MPFSRSQVAAASMSPLVSCSAFLQSIIPAPVRSRRALTSFAEIVGVLTGVLSLGLGGLFGLGGGDGRIGRLVLGRRRGVGRRPLDVVALRRGDLGVRALGN